MMVGMLRSISLFLGLGVAALANFLVLVLSGGEFFPALYASATFAGILVLLVTALAGASPRGVIREISYGFTGALIIGAVFIGIGFALSVR